MKVPFKAKCVKFGERYDMEDGKVYTILAASPHSENESMKCTIEGQGPKWWCIFEGTQDKISNEEWNSGAWLVFKKQEKWWKDE